MTIESKLESLTNAVLSLVATLEARQSVVSVQAAPVTVAPAVPAPVPVAPAPVEPVPVLAPAPVAVVATAPVMPAPPTFAAPEPTPVAAGAPFSDQKGMVEYVMGAYKLMGPVKGANIQNVLSKMGYMNINDVKPADYADLYAGIEALK